MAYNILSFFENRQNLEDDSQSSQQIAHPDLCGLVHSVDVRARETGWGSV